MATSVIGSGISGLAIAIVLAGLEKEWLFGSQMTPMAGN